MVRCGGAVSARPADVEAAQDFSDHLPGWPLTGLATIVAREVRHRQFASAATLVMRARALRDARGRLEGGGVVTVAIAPTFI